MEISQEELDQFKKDLRIVKFQLQEAQDTLEGGITSRNLTEFRNTYVINAQDSLDDSYDMLVPFNIISEMIKIVSVKVSFWILPFRAYSTAVPSGGGDTTVSGGGDTSGSGGVQTSVSGGSHSHTLSRINTITNTTDGHYHGYSHATTVSSTAAHHHHSVADHTHTTPDHTHATPAHAHDITFGIYEEDNS